MHRSTRQNHISTHLSTPRTRRGRGSGQASSRPVVAYRQRGRGRTLTNSFNAPELWHEPRETDQIRYHVQPAGKGYVHAVTIDEVRQRVSLLPEHILAGLEVVQLSRMTRKRALFPCYGMQWGCAVYLYPVEESLVETYVRPPRPEQIKEAGMYGGRWFEEGQYWKLAWTAESVRDFYLNNVLIHEIGHVFDTWNSSFDARERYANWFADEYGFRASRGRR